ncbi:TPA: glycosyltransferase [Vibrio vulnificus]|uniref:glycosyltransferase n=1 Tax=Vibrio vulnificus TaxID=672 RepID=UPI001A2EAE5F|nr:glycosyltransferase [Vibrio vulnificus]ELU0081929.1 glycosyltransferase [Vibrio vulnificus]HAS6081738.1 glycosyltransferase [Vibrio vulnificus]
MNIFLLINSMEGGGAERVVSLLANYYVNEDYNVWVFTLDKGDDAYYLDKRIKRVDLGCYNYIGKCLKYRKFLRENNPKYNVSFLFRSNIVNVICCIKEKRKAILSERTNSNVRYRGILGWIKKNIMKLTYSNSDRVIAISLGVKESLKNIGLDENKIEVIYNPVLSSGFSDSRVRSIDRKSIRLVTVGRLIESKNHKFIIDVVEALINDMGLDVTLNIIGDGPLREEINKYINAKNLQYRVFMLGWRDDVYNELDKNDIFLFSSLYEGFGNVLVEAMSLGLPIVSFDCESGPREILTGVLKDSLVSVNDKKQFINKILNLINNEEYYKTMSKCSIERSKSFSISEIANRYLEVSNVEEH